MAKKVIYDSGNTAEVDVVYAAVVNDQLQFDEAVAIMDNYLASHLSTSGSGNVNEVEGLGQLLFELVQYARSHDLNQ
mgnify:CR=1 FL=1